MSASEGLQVACQVTLRALAACGASTGPFATGVEETPLVSQGSFSPLPEVQA